MKFPRTLAAGLAALAVLTQPTFATWSIVVVNTVTGEVGVGSATCLANVNLIPTLPVIYPGLGAAAVQAAGDSSGQRKLVIWNGFAAGSTPSEIFTQLATIGGHQQRQYGIVNVFGPPLTWTGNGAGQGKHGVVGEVGDLRYAIQGNVLVGPEPVDAAEVALLSTPGDLGQKLMAAMEAARAMGGDGRCSCSNAAPTSCGAPPPGTWKSAHTGFVLLARTGDKIGQCGGNAGCATGPKYMKLNAVGSATDPDPVFTLQTKYDAWRISWQGRPDHLKSVMSTSAQQLVADGQSTLDVLVQLIDIEGVPLTSGGASLTLTNLSGAPDATTPGPVQDNGDGSYTFTLTAGTAAGADDWELKFNDGIGNVRLYPRLQVPVLPLSMLHTGYHTVSVAAGASVPLIVNAGPASGSEKYLVLGSAAGTTPWTPTDFALIPLARDDFMEWSAATPNVNPFVNTASFLDGNGRAEAAFMPTPSQLTPWVGSRLDWSVVVFDPSGASASTPVGFDIVP